MRDHRWIQTYTGKQFWPLDPKPEDIRDIAHALSMSCRFTGHCLYFYSVAQHSVLVSEHCSDPKWGLLHDASEAYVADIARPIKSSLTNYAAIEQRIMACVAERFGLGYLYPDDLHEMDMRALVTERRDLMGPCEEEWGSIAEFKPFPQSIYALSPMYAERMFMDRFTKLYGE